MAVDRVKRCALASTASIKGRELHHVKPCHLLKDSAVVKLAFQGYIRHCRNAELLTQCICGEGSNSALTLRYLAFPLVYLLHNMASVSELGRLKATEDYLCNVYLCCLGANL